MITNDGYTRVIGAAPWASSPPRSMWAAKLTCDRCGVRFHARTGDARGAVCRDCRELLALMGESW